MNGCEPEKAVVNEGKAVQLIRCLSCGEVIGLSLVDKSTCPHCGRCYRPYGEHVRPVTKTL